MSYGDDECALAFWQNVQVFGSMVGGYKIVVRAGSLDKATPFDTGFGGSDVNLIDVSSGVFAAKSEYCKDQQPLLPVSRTERTIMERGAMSLRDSCCVSHKKSSL